MKNKENRQLVVYLSKSLKTSEDKLQAVRSQLAACGFIVTEYKGGTYDEKIRKKADFVLMLPNSLPETVGERRWYTSVGKGQFSEIVSACKEDQPAFIYMGYENGEILMSKCNENAGDHYTTDTLTWKCNYGMIASFVISRKPVPLYPFITGYMSMSRGINHNVNRYQEYPSTIAECYKRNRLLLLLN